MKHGIERRWFVGLLYACSLLILGWGAVCSPYTYDDPRFVVYYGGTELVLAVVLVTATWFLRPTAMIGLRAPGPKVEFAQVLPLLVMLSVALLSWCRVRYMAPIGVSAAVPSWHILRTTLLVGFTEEWMYRGLLFAALSHWYGLRKGALIAIVLFGLLHALNVFAGLPVAAAGLQVGMAALSGSIFVLAAHGFRSIWAGMLAHGFYDFLVIDAAQWAAVGAPHEGSYAVLGVNLLLGIHGLRQLAKFRGEEAFV